MPHLPDRHTTHDLALVAAFAADDAAGADRELASTLVRDCAACASLAHDLRTLARATAALPAPRRTRDFTLTAEQAARLRPSGWRRLLGAFSGPRFSFAAPLGGSIATLGLVALLVTALPGSLGGGLAVAPLESMDLDTRQQVVTQSPYAGEVHTAGGELTPETEQPGTPDLFADTLAELTQARGLDELVVILGGSGLLVGFALLLLRWSATRFS